MSLLRIAPGHPGFEYRTFECATCDNVDTRMAVRDAIADGSK